VGAGEGRGAANLGRERAEEEVPRWTELDGANGRAAAVGRASRTGAALYSQMGREKRGKSK
jgi:hypothetical protein